MIGILCSRVRIEEKLLFGAFQKLRQEVIHLDPRELALGAKNKNRQIRVLFNREISQVRSELVLNYFEAHAIKTINSAKTTTICNNKALSTWVLQRAEIPMPKTTIVFSLEQAKCVAKEFTFPVVLKPILGSWGRLLAKVETEEMLESIIEHKEALHTPYQQVFYIQEFIDKPQRDIRVLVIGKEPVAAMFRESVHWITNTALGGSPKKCPLDADLISLVKKTVAVLETDIAGVDIVETDEGYKVLEVNGIAEFHGLQSVTEFNIAERIAEYVINL
jgi:[lysine-biosynthesis-protein LysW]---L-2-aminoadipate ligase